MMCPCMEYVFFPNLNYLTILRYIMSVFVYIFFSKPIFCLLLGTYVREW